MLVRDDNSRPSVLGGGGGGTISVRSSAFARVPLGRAPVADASHRGRSTVVNVLELDLVPCTLRSSTGRDLETVRVVKEALAVFGCRAARASQILQTGAWLGRSAGRRMALDIPRVPSDIGTGSVWGGWMRETVVS